jgi:hypothetical protein
MSSGAPIIPRTGGAVGNAWESAENPQSCQVYVRGEMLDIVSMPGAKK